MSDKIFEKVSPGKVVDNIKHEAKEKSKQLVSDIVKSFTDKGFDKKEITPLIKEGVKQGADS